MLWVYGVISHHISPGHTHFPTQSHAHTFLIRSCPQSVLNELLICRSNCSHSSSWIQVSVIALNRFLGRRMIVCARVSKKRCKNRLYKCTRMQMISILLLFSLFLLDSSKCHCPQQVSRSEDDRLRESFPETAQKSSPQMHTYANDFRIIALPILRPTIHSSMCCSLFVSVALTCPLFLQIGNTLRKSRHTWQQ